MKESIICFIGGGNMASSLIGGLLQTGVSANNLRVADTNPNALASYFPIQTYNDNLQAIQDANVIVLAVKPQQMAEVAKSIATALPEHPPLFISIAAGIRIADLNRWLGKDRAIPIVRVMPNTPALVQSGASALCASTHVSKQQHELAENILRAVGLTVWLTDENMMDAVTALSGSGPAYFFLLMEILEKTGVQLGLPQETARLLTLQTAFGAAKMALESSEDAATLRARVTSKGGTTEQAINTLQASDIQALFDRALQAAQTRATSMADEYGEQA
ncbi:pyrroline-5-carboxylate reductase [Beggiatoa leptomitoformis]|uniref:Pyrroline-5-carboxylate reductase n=1 Tax=Beggiatoa leptomitoformis TaxID=288004 RepID=A0A2N9YDE6_9GAMM|nr:pyrroline-5-carboxylate reductase [Beggiatoa leptomitoformis]ALG69082.1 pyrroline-5-carboxylate reductase [Beggiatoa leptomitoformis]AUI68507.1 pyrroline-5-carboxylate reductase [Beggiatoa leptomitoformis]